MQNTNQLVIVERGRGVVEVINEDGDPAVLNKQHNPQWLGDGAVVVADSENHRVVELHRNASTGEWEVAWVLTEAGGMAFDWPRDADRLPNGNTLITDSRNDRVVEVGPGGDLVASYATAPLPYEADRVPVGEAGGQPYEPKRGAPGRLPGRVPLLTTLLGAAHHVVPVPYWVSELHLAVVFVAGAMIVVGGYLVARGRDGRGPALLQERERDPEDERREEADQ